MDQLGELDRIRIGGNNVSIIRYTDDIIVYADSEEKLQGLVNRLQEECREKGIRNNKSKTEVME